MRRRGNRRKRGSILDEQGPRLQQLFTITIGTLHVKFLVIGISNYHVVSPIGMSKEIYLRTFPTRRKALLLEPLRVQSTVCNLQCLFEFLNINLCFPSTCDYIVIFSSQQSNSVRGEFLNVFHG